MFLATTVTDIKKCQIPAHSTVLLLHLNSYSRTGQELLYYYNFKLTPSPNIPPEDLNMHQGEIWSADRVETTLRTRGWHQHAALWRRSRGSPDAQWFHSGCWTDSTRGGRVSHLRLVAGQLTADWPHMTITCSESGWFSAWRPLPLCCYTFIHLFCLLIRMLLLIWVFVQMCNTSRM